MSKEWSEWRACLAIVKNWESMLHEITLSF